MSVIHGLISRVSNAMGCLFRLRSNRAIRSILVRCGRKFDRYLSARIKYHVKYAFYTAKVNNLIHSLATTRVVTRVRAARGSTNVHMSSIILVKVNRPLSGCSRIIHFLHVLNRRNNIRVNVQRVSLSAYNLIPNVRHLTGRRVPLALSVSLRTPGSAVHSHAVPIGHH